jgi:hypothetical protein
MMNLKTTSITTRHIIRAPTRHASPGVGHYAVNAITGDKYAYKVGTIDSLRLFRVLDSTSRFSDDGKYIKASNRSVSNSRDPKYLFYDGPKEYMSHTGNTVDQHKIEKWKAFQQKLTDDKGNVNPTAYSDYQKTQMVI